MNITSFLARHSTEILTGAAIVGVVGTAVLTADATIKAVEHLRREDLLYDAFTEQAKQTFAYYIPPIVSGGCTIASILLLRKSLVGRVEAGWLAASIAQQQLKEYRDRVRELYGEDKDRSVLSDIAGSRAKDIPAGSVIVTGNDVACLDLYSGRTFSSTPDAIMKAENRINHNLAHGESVSLNEFYDAIGLEHTKAGDNLGWGNYDSVELILSSHLMADNTPVLTVTFDHDPRPDFYHIN